MKLKTMFSLFKPSLIIFSLLTVACDSKDSNPKDYWTINEPEIYAWDTSENANFRGFNSLATEFDSSEITASLGYESYVLFKDRETIKSLQVQSRCVNEITGVILTNGNLNDKETAGSIKIPYSRKVYFHNFLPDGVVFDDSDQLASPNYNCSFNFIARNTIGSERNFFVENIKINTNARNEIQVLAVDRQGSNIERTIQPIRRQTQAQRPSVYFNSNENTFVFDKTMNAGNLAGPAEIKCLGKENSFKIQTRNGELTQALEQPFFNLSNDDQTAFLKKCRILASLDLEPDLVVDSSDDSKDIRTVWSEYFNVIFDEPRLEVKVTNNPTLSAENYPFNTTNYLDSSVTVFQMEITNNSRQNLILHLPSDQKIQAQLTPLFYIGQKANYMPTNILNSWGGLRLFQTQESFETELKFMQEGRRAVSLEILSGHSQVVDLVIDKNFMCSFANVEFLHEQPTSERGFSIKAIELGSLQDQLRIDYRNQKTYESFPDLFSLNTLLEKSEGKYNSIRNSNSAQRRFKTNLLQLNMNRTSVIDTFIFRDKSDIDLLPQTNMRARNIITVLGESPISRTMYFEIRDHKRSSHFPSIIYTDSSTDSSCLQLY